MQRDKQEKFKELANKRVNKTVKNLRLVANLANKKNYDYSDEQAKQILRALQRELDDVKMCFTTSKKSTEFDFHLD